MFTGIIETIGEVVSVLGHDDIVEMTVRSPISGELRVDQSVNHNGVCLTVVHTAHGMHRVQLVKETCDRSTFGNIMTGDRVNLERAMPANGRFEGHIVQGHVDCTGTLVSIDENLYTFSYPASYARLIVEKGSICIDGISLTVAAVTDDTFSVALIPYTLDNTIFGALASGDRVNLEFDILGKYLLKMAER